MIPSLLLAALLAAAAAGQPPAAPAGPPAWQQQQRPLSLRVDQGAGTLQLGPVLDDRELAEAAQSGVPIRLRVRVELWRDKFIDGLVESSTWSTVVAYEPLTQQYFVRSTAGDQRARVFTSFEQVRGAIERAYPIRSTVRREGRYYYTAALDIETLSLSDLKELERWLQGDLQPAVGGDQSIPQALGEGAKRLLIRVLGVPNRHYETRSDRFRIERA